MTARINSRAKGASFERTIAKELFLLTGIRFERDLEQVRRNDRGDLLADDPAWPYSVECKSYAAGTGCRDAWKAQASRAAAAAGKVPAVIFKFNRCKPRVTLPLTALCPALPADQWVEMSLEGFAALAAEKMAGASNVR